MPPKPTRTPADKPATLKVVPLEASELPTITIKGAGRPKKNQMPPMPKMEVSPLEQSMYDNFIESHRKEHPDLTPSDLILLGLAAWEYVNYTRVLYKELEENEVISMARQAPYTPMLQLLDRLSVTRKARKQAPDSQSTEARDTLRKFFG